MTGGIGSIFEDMDKAANTFFGKYLPEQKGEHMTEKEYNEIEAVRRSDLLKLRRSPLHYKWATEHPEASTPAMAFGSAAHKFILEGAEAFAEEYAVAPYIDRRTKIGKEEYEHFLQNNQGKTILATEDFETLTLMHFAMKAHPEAWALIHGEHETTHVWTDAETGEKCKIRLDCLTTFEGRPTIVDYKTVNTCEDRAFERDCRQYGYKIQAGMYTEGGVIAHHGIMTNDALTLHNAEFTQLDSRRKIAFIADVAALADFTAGCNVAYPIQDRSTGKPGSLTQLCDPLTLPSVHICHKKLNVLIHLQIIIQLPEDLHTVHTAGHFLIDEAQQIPRGSIFSRQIANDLCDLLAEITGLDNYKIRHSDTS